jgi:SAM-dependent methyltransferase
MEDLEREFEKRKPWITQFTIDGKKYGGDVVQDNDVRVAFFFQCFPDVKTILDLGSLEGGHTFQLAQRPGTSVIGIEGRDYNVAKADFMKSLLKVNNVQFICANLEEKPLSSFGRFDAVFCSGLLYHLPRPWELIREIGKVTPKVFIWTHYAVEERAHEEIQGFRGYWYDEFGYQDPLSGMSKRSFWVTLTSLEKMLQESGFPHVRIISNVPEHEHGAVVMLGAWR